MRGAGFSQTRKDDQSCVLSKGEFSAAADSLQDINISKIQDNVNFWTLLSSNRPISPSNLTIGLRCSVTKLGSAGDLDQPHTF